MGEDLLLSRSCDGTILLLQDCYDDSPNFSRREFSTASIQRTAYPRFKRMFGTRDLQEHYTPTQQEWNFVQQATRLPQLRFNMIVLLKVFQ